MRRASAIPTILQGNSPSRGLDAVSFLITFDDGRIYAQPLNGRLNKGEVAKFLKTTEDGVAYLAKKGLLKLLGHPDEAKKKLFAANELLLLMQDSRWLGKVTDCLYQLAEEKNGAQSRRSRKTGKGVAACSKHHAP